RSRARQSHPRRCRHGAHSHRRSHRRRRIVRAGAGGAARLQRDPDEAVSGRAAPQRDQAGDARLIRAIIRVMRNRWIPTLALVFCAATIAPAQESKPQNLPYAAVHNPEFIAVAAATFMSADDRVIGVAHARGAKAYPAGILAQHGLVEDDSPDGPIAVTW